MRRREDLNLNPRHEMPCGCITSSPLSSPSLHLSLLLSRLHTASLHSPHPKSSIQLQTPILGAGDMTSAEQAVQIPRPTPRAKMSVTGQVSATLSGSHHSPGKMPTVQRLPREVGQHPWGHLIPECLPVSILLQKRGGRTSFSHFE